MSARIRAPGLWTLSSVVTPAEFDTFDENQSQAVDGRGGTYAPSTPIVIGEASPGVGGLRVTAKAQFDGPFECNAASAAFTAGMTVAGLAIFSDTLVAQVAQVTTTLQVGAEATVGGQLHANGGIIATAPSTFNADVTIGAGLLAGATILGSLAVSGLTTATGGIITGSAGIIIGGGGGLVVTGTTRFQDYVELFGAGHIRVRAVAGATSNTNYGVDTVDEVLVSHSTTGISYRITNTGSGEGSKMKFAIVDTTSTAAVSIVRDADSAIFGTLGNSVGQYTDMEFTFQGGAWRRVAYRLAA